MIKFGVSDKSLKHLILSLKILVTLVILWFLAKHSQLNVGLFFTLLDNPFSTLSVIVLYYLMILINTWRWYRLNTIQKIDLPFFQTIKPTYLGVAFNAVLPGNVGGDFIRTYFVLKKFPQQKSAAILSILTDRVMGLMGMLCIICIISPVFWQIAHQNYFILSILLTCIGCFSAGVIIFLFGTMWFNHKISFIGKINEKLSGKLSSLFEAINIYRNAKSIMLETLGLSMLIQIGLLIGVLMISSSMDLPSISPFHFMLALIVAQIANLLPLTPGGIGIGEAAFANIIVLLNPGTTAAYATVFLAIRVLSILTYLPGVGLGIFGFHLLDRRYVTNNQD